MNVIFLDLDGVLNTGKYMDALLAAKRLEIMRNGISLNNKVKTKDQYGDLFDPEAVRWLENIITVTGADIVISSTWRFSGLDMMKRMWIDRGLPGKVIGITIIPTIRDFPHHEDNGALQRSDEIELYIKEHDIDNYIIIDDNFHPSVSQESNFILCDAYLGLTRKKAIEAIYILNKHS